MSALLPALIAVLLFAQTTMANTITVTSTADSGAGTLRAALASAADGDTIDASGVTGTILLTSGELLVTNSVTILGPGPANLAVNGNAAMTPGQIQQLTITGTYAGGLTASIGSAQATWDVSPSNPNVLSVDGGQAVVPSQESGGSFDVTATSTVLGFGFAK